MKSIYTTSVSNVPTTYNNPTAAYKKHVWIAVAGILAFFVFYLFMTFWFFSSAYRLLSDAFGGGNSNFLSVGIGIASLFLGIFMIKAFFFVQTKYDVQDRQVKPEDEPVLFDYLHKLADEIGAPTPSKVYLSNRVNASVFYDLSFLNLFFPSKKNLEIGLGLINVLNLGEFKAVLAHEYGHFAQKSMLVGRWVYIANQIANTIITRRDASDSLLRGLSRIDIRIAWIGWILSIIVWSIRSLVELIFRVVVLSQRALSREMEFQADLVSVSVTGSDALIHALHKLQAADAALSDAMGALSEQLNKGKAVEDLYAIQSNAIEKTAYILNDDEYGKSPKIPERYPQKNRIFSNKIAQPPKMWLTHPPDQERELNAKKHYIPGRIDDRSAWDLFDNPQQIRNEMTSDLIASANVKTELLSTPDSLILHNKQFEKSYFNPNYRGIYLNRFFCQDYKKCEDIYLPNITREKSANLIAELYPTTLIEELEDFTTLKEEMAQLEAIKNKQLEASGEGGIWHRGTQIRKKELPNVISSVKSEVAVASSRITDHDRLVRTVHLRLAEKIKNGWDEYLKGLLSIVHYSEHNINNIQDAQRNLNHVFSIVMADNKVSSSELSVLVYESNQVHTSLKDVAKIQKNITYDNQLLKELELEEGNLCLKNLYFHERMLTILVIG
jgi:Zn-dependent protease with chaperone function